MNAKYILEAIKALNEAERALMTGNASIAQQIDISGKCWHAGLDLKNALLIECPEIKVEMPNG